MRMVAAGNAEIVGESALPARSNYFIGNDTGKWHNAIDNFARVRYRNIYPGIDLVYYGNQQQLEYDFVVAPGADAGRIALDFTGAARIEIDDRGELVLDTAAGEIHQAAPHIYQQTAQGS